MIEKSILDMAQVKKSEESLLRSEPTEHGDLIFHELLAYYSFEKIMTMSVILAVMWFLIWFNPLSFASQNRIRNLNADLDLYDTKRKYSNAQQ